MHHHNAADYDLIEKRIKEELEYFEKFSLHSDQHNHYTILLQKICPGRLKKNEPFPKPLRAVFSYLMHLNLEAMGGEFPDYCKKRFWTGQLPFVVEVIMTILYYDNQILDQKGDVIGHRAICNNVLIGRQLQAQLCLYIQDRIPVELQTKVLTLVNEVLMVVCAGQFKERSHNFYQHWLNEEFDHYDFEDWAKNQIPHHLIDDILNLIYKVCPELAGKKEAFLTNYLGRVYLVNGFFFERITQLMLDLLVTPFEEKQKKEELIEFSQVFGIMHQLVNDNNDFIPSHLSKDTAAKNRTDSFSDLRTQNITLPLFIYLVENPDFSSDKNNPIMYFFNQVGSFPRQEFPYRANSFEKRIFRTICRSLTIYYCMEITSHLRLKLEGMSKKMDVYHEIWEEHLNVGNRNKLYIFFLSNGKYFKKYLDVNPDSKLQG